MMYGVKRFWDIKHASFNAVAFFVVVISFYHIHVNQIVQNDWENENIAAHCLTDLAVSQSQSTVHMAGRLVCVCVCVRKPYWPFKINDFCLVFWLLLSLKMFSSMLSSVRIFSLLYFTIPLVHVSSRYWLSPVTVPERACTSVCCAYPNEYKITV